MAHAELLKFGEQFLCAFRVQMFHAAAAICGDDLEFHGFGCQQSGNESTAARFKVAQNAHLVCESRLCVWSVVSLEYPSIKAQMDGGTESIFGCQHTTGSVPVSRLGFNYHRLQGRGSGIAAVLQPLCRVQRIEGNTDNVKAFGVDGPCGRPMRLTAPGMGIGSRKSGIKKRERGVPTTTKVCQRHNPNRFNRWRKAGLQRMFCNESN
jgi:hypothetical protein